jgi:hypothetical protein
VTWVSVWPVAGPGSPVRLNRSIGSRCPPAAKVSDAEAGLDEPAGGGGVFDVTIRKAGIYPFVSHSFASVMLGEVGLLNVGNVAGR